jgi:predicted amidohydrolase YtcJ
MRNSLLSLMLVTVAAILGCSPNPEPEVSLEEADLVFRNGSVYTVDINRSWAKAIAIKDDRIVFVGSDEDAAAFIGAATQVVDLQGKMVLPGLQDIHIHPISGGVEASRVDLNTATTLDDYETRIRDYSVEHPGDPWILGGGWLMSVFGPGGKASKSILDELVPDRPVYLSSADGHTAWVNSNALEIAGIDKDTPNPPDGIIDKDPVTGEPFGSLQEGAGYLVSKHIPEYSQEELMDGLRYAVRMLNGYGITGMQVAYSQVSEDDIYRSLDDAGELTLHTVTALWWQRDQGLEQIEELVERRKTYTRGEVRATSVKIMQDGVMENYTAVMLEPYKVEGSPRGISMVEPEFLKKAVTALDANGFQVHFHAIGNGAIRQSLDAVEAARKINGNLGHRHHISHLQLIHPDDIPRFRELDVVANFQPLWAFADAYITELTLPFISEETARWMYPIDSIYKTGGMIAFGSDWSVSSANPWDQIETAVTRMGSRGETKTPYLPEERVRLPEALAAFTINAAYVNGMEKEAGSLEPGKLADLVILDRNLFAIDAREISETRALLTLFRGRPVHGEIARL